MAAGMLQVSLEDDVVLSQANEYEILQLLLGECRDRLTSYEGKFCTLTVHTIHSHPQG